MKYFMFRDNDRLEVMVNIDHISSIYIEGNVVHIITINGGRYAYCLPEQCRTDRDIYLKKFYNAIRRKVTMNKEIFVITVDDVINENITTI